MNVDREALLTYFRQRAEVGDRELFLDGLTALEAMALLKSRPAPMAQDQTRVAPTRPIAMSEPASSASQPRVPAARTTATQPRASDPARTAAANAALEAIKSQVTGCQGCTLHAGTANLVFGEGSPTADVMVVGEAPGQEEDRTGRPFVGQAGKLLDLLLMTAGFPRPDVYICNTLKCRPPNNRNPLPAELASCSGFLHGQIDAIQPRALIAVGKFAAQALLQSEESIGRLRGQIHTYRGIPLIVTYHPAYLLRTPSASRVAWQDFQRLRQVLDEQA